MQAAPPYDVVHVNAAFSRLTGVHNVSIIGCPISKALSLVQSSQEEKPYQRNDNLETKTTQKMSSKSIKETSSNGDRDGSSPDLSGMTIGNEMQRISVSHENAAQAGMRVANQERGDFTLEHLIASNNFRSIYKVNCREIRGDTSTDESKNSSIASKETPRSLTPYVISVCPILNNPISHLVVQFFSEDDIQVVGKNHNLPTDIRGDGLADDNGGADSGDSSLSNPSSDPPVTTNSG